MARPEIPSEVTADYCNEGAEAALTALQATPDYAHLAAALCALREGYLVVDVTGGVNGKKGTRIRTIRSTRGELVLPLFTSMAALREATTGQHDRSKGAVMAAREALALIRSDRFVAAEINPGRDKLVLLRKYIELAAGDDDITATVLENMRS